MNGTSHTAPLVTLCPRVCQRRGSKVSWECPWEFHPTDSGAKLKEIDQNNWLKFLILLKNIVCNFNSGQPIALFFTRGNSSQYFMSTLLVSNNLLFRKKSWSSVVGVYHSTSLRWPLSRFVTKCNLLRYTSPFLRSTITSNGLVSWNL